jgi:RND family efflux transporter MFP subunit
MDSKQRANWRYFAGFLGLVVLIVMGLFSASRLRSAAPAADAKPVEHAKAAAGSPRVETVHPIEGGLKRHTAQPGAAHSFESAELYAKISGFLKEQHVDIGSRVKEGALLAEIDVPELAEDVDAAKAGLLQAQAEVAQAEARVESAIADQKAAESRIAQAKSEVERCQAGVGLSQKQYDRIRELNELKGIEDRIVDERMFQLQSDQATLQAAKSAVMAAEQQAAAAASQIGLAKAELAVSKSKVTVAESQLDRAKLMLGYTQIVSPYEGVVTDRNFHRGAYVRSPDHGGQIPLLKVDRTDKMRVVVRIPERDVPYVQPGDKTTIRFDALPLRRFENSIARIAESEEAATRTMLAEIDLENADGVIRNQMYGRVEIALEDSQVGVTVPSTCLVGDVAQGKAKLFVVIDDVAKLRQVEVGRDTGIEVEILKGISPQDFVIVRPPGNLADGAKVASVPWTPSANAH